MCVPLATVLAMTCFCLEVWCISEIIHLEVKDTSATLGFRHLNLAGSGRAVCKSFRSCATEREREREHRVRCVPCAEA